MIILFTFFMHNRKLYTCDGSSTTRRKELGKIIKLLS